MVIRNIGFWDNATVNNAETLYTGAWVLLMAPFGSNKEPYTLTILFLYFSCHNS